MVVSKEQSIESFSCPVVLGGGDCQRQMEVMQMQREAKLVFLIYRWFIAPVSVIELPSDVGCPRLGCKGL